MALMDYLLPPEMFYDWTESEIIRAAPDRESADLLHRMLEEWGGETVHFGYLLGDPVWNIIWEEVIPGERSPSSAMAEVAPEAQAKLDDMFGYE